MSLGVKVLFGNLSLVCSPAFLSRTKALRMAGYSPSYPVNTYENEVRLRKLSSIILQQMTKAYKKTKR